MIAQMWLQNGLVVLIFFLLSIPVGRYLADIVMDRKPFSIRSSTLPTRPYIG